MFCEETSPNTPLPSEDNIPYSALRKISELETHLILWKSKALEQEVSFRERYSELKSNYQLLLDAVGNMPKPPTLDPYQLLHKLLPPQVKTSCLDLFQEPDRSQYPRIRFWKKSDWMAQAKNEDGTDNTDFVEDDYGNTLDGYFVRSVIRMAYTVWRDIPEDKIPATWEDADPDLVNEFGSCLYGHFDFLRYCARHWKVHCIAELFYPGWHSGAPAPFPEFEPEDVTESEDSDE